jgi:hypothetical protein
MRNPSLWSSAEHSHTATERVKSNTKARKKENTKKKEKEDAARTCVAPRPVAIFFIVFHFF